MLPAPPAPDEPITVVCAATYLADGIPAYAFVFRVDATGTRFTAYASDPDRYVINGTYRLALTEPGDLSVSLSGDEWAFLRHCLHNVEQRWRDAIAEADAGAERPQPDRPAQPDHLNVEPTQAGYRAVAGRFRDELDRVRRLTQRLDQQIHAADAHPEGDQP